MASPTLLQQLHRRFEYWLFDLPAEAGGVALHFALVPLRYVYGLVRDFVRGDLGLRAMGLVYSSLFALVPAIAVSFSVLKAFGYHRELEPMLFEFLRPLGVRGFELTASVMQFVENARTTVLGTLGFAFLLYTVISMIRKVEDALNFTWHVERPRSLARRISEYLVIMLIGPIVAVAALVLLTRIEASATLAKLSGLAGAAAQGGQARVTPYLLIIALFWFMYYYMPNTRVRWQASLVGALFGGATWVATGAVFARVAVYATQTAAMYAGFAIVLLSLVWLHLSWLIMLFGGQLSFYVQHPEHLRTGHGAIPTTAILRERIAMAAMFLVAERFVDGGERWKVSDLADRIDVPASVLDGVLCNLEDRGLVLTAEDDTVVPARDIASITLADVLDAVRHEAPDPRRPEPRGVDVADAAALAADSAMRERMSRTTVRDLVTRARTPAVAAATATQ